MFSKKSLLIPAVIIFTSFFGVSAASAQATQRCYTVASLQGNYSIVATYGANVAIALATRSYDGNGNLTGNFVLNQPTAGSTTGARSIVTGTQAGTYTVNCNGTGKINRLLTSSTGVTAIQVDDFIITGAIVQSGVLIATSIADAVEVSSALVPGGILVTRVQNRLPDFAY
jgi:hypothetical protein